MTQQFTTQPEHLVSSWILSQFHSLDSQTVCVPLLSMVSLIKKIEEVLQIGTRAHTVPVELTLLMQSWYVQNGTEGTP